MTTILDTFEMQILACLNLLCEPFLVELVSLASCGIPHASLLMRRETVRVVFLTTMLAWFLLYRSHWILEIFTVSGFRAGDGCG
jgi:hypothetical protein